MAFFALFSTSLLCTMLIPGLCSGMLFDQPPYVLLCAFGGAFSGALCNVGLMLAYKYTDISLAYPMARALPVFLTMAATSLFGWGRSLSFTAMTGMLVIFVCCAGMAFSGGKQTHSLLDKILAVKRGLAGILLAAAGTTGYTIIDSFGVKAVVSAFPDHNRILVVSAYSCTREIIAATLMWLMVFAGYRMGKDRGSLRELSTTVNPYLAGVFAALAYGLILIAMNYVSNVSFVQAFRQLSLPLSALLGFFILKEKISRFRWLCLCGIMAGLLLTVL